MMKSSKICEKVEFIKNNFCLSENEKVQTISEYFIVISYLDKKIAEMSYLKNSRIIKDNLLNLIKDSQFSNQCMWKVRQKLGLKNNDTPIAKYDKKGQLITTKAGILNLYEQEYKDRLKPSSPHKGYEDLQSLKDLLFQLRFRIASSKKSRQWTEEDIIKVSKTLKNNKARDSEGMIYELFKPSKCGRDVSLSITKMFNSIKTNLSIPSFFEKMTITSIQKNNKKSKFHLSNERGIFNLSKLKSLMDKLIYEDVYQTVDNNLSCSNAGGRKGRGCRDQIFILHGIINEVVHGNREPICLQSVDVVMCFDKMNFPETHNDLWDVCVQDRNFALLATLDQKCTVKIKTPCGETKTLTLKEIIMQGSVFGSLKCTVQVDSLGRDLLSQEETIGLYRYKECVDIPPLAYCDDVLAASECGVEALETNAAINVKFESKNLSLSKDKCQQLHIGKRKRIKEECKTSKKLLVHEATMKEAERIKFLGEIITISGSLDENIEDRSNRAIGIRSKLKSLISGISLVFFILKFT